MATDGTLNALFVRDILLKARHKEPQKDLFVLSHRNTTDSVLSVKKKSCTTFLGIPITFLNLYIPSSRGCSTHHPVTEKTFCNVNVYDVQCCINVGQIELFVFNRQHSATIRK